METGVTVYYEVQERLGATTWLPLWVNSRFDTLREANVRKDQKTLAMPEKNYRVVRVRIMMEVM